MQNNQGEISETFQTFYRVLSTHKQIFIGIKCINDEKELSFGARALFNKIYALSAKEGYCYASNAYLSREIGMSESTLKKYLNELIALDLIETKMVGSSRNRTRRIYIRFRTITSRYLKGNKIKKG